MSSVLISELPQILFDEQRADACNVKYHRPEDVFDHETWKTVVSTACKNGDLPTNGGTVSVADVNDWLANGGLGLWSVFELHDPILPDMDGMFEGDYAKLPADIRERISSIFRFSPWDDLAPEKRWEKVHQIDATNTPMARLLFGLGNVVYWRDEIGPSQTLLAAAERELHDWVSLTASAPSEKELRDRRKTEIREWVYRLSSFRDLMLIGCLNEDQEITGMIQILLDARQKNWCSDVYFPVWLDGLKTPKALVSIESDNQPASGGRDDELFPTTSENRVTTHNIKRRRNDLDPVIEMAIKEAGNSDYQQVWAILVKHADSTNPPPPLTGYSSDGVQYKGKKYEINGELDTLTKDALRKRLKPNAR